MNVEEPELPAPPLAEPDAPCWRCGLPASAMAARCPHCAARLHAAPTRSARPPAGPLNSVLVGFALLLVVSVLQAAFLKVAGPNITDETRLGGVIGFELLDTLVVLGVFASCGRVPLPASEPTWRFGAWAVAAPVLAALLTLNVAYHLALRSLLPDLPLEPPTDLSVAWIAVMCVQPAVVEELFFRYLALGALRRVCGLHAAVWVSAGMFAAAHLYQPLGMPYLFLVGGVLGYARVSTGGLLLPVLLHFGHNLAVLSLEKWL